MIGARANLEIRQVIRHVALAERMMSLIAEMVQDGENGTEWRECGPVQLVKIISGPAKILTAFSIPSLGREL
jgi:hypothetical protein